jgi:glycosyltransferase involved in cell wall biosynthesis
MQEQTFSDFELILSDNASTDGSLELARRLAREDSRIRIVENARNCGAAFNVRRVFLEGRAPYFKWASSNDLCAPQLVERCLTELERSPDVVLCYTRAVLFHDEPEDGNRYEERFEMLDERASLRFRTLLECMRLNNLFGGVYRRAALERVRLLGDYMGSDIMMLAELALLGKFMELPEYDYYRRMDRQTATAMMKGEGLYEHLLGHRHAPKMQCWRQTAVLAAAALRHPVSPREFVRTFGYLARRTYWHLPQLAAELKLAVMRPSAR